MKSVIIIDDEQFCVDVLVELITAYLPDVKILGQFTDPELAINSILLLKPDILFLDIEMPALSGFDVIDRLKPFEFNVIFTTAHDDMALKAYKYGVKNYLLKPITLSDLKLALDKLNLNTDIKHPLEIKSKITINTHDGIHVINIDEILYCEADDSYCHIYLIQKSFLASKTLKEIESQIGNHSFFRIHNSYLVNVDKIVKYTKADGGMVTMTNQKEIPISRSKKEEFIKFMDKL